MLKYSREELLTRTIRDLLDPSDWPRLAASKAALDQPGVVEVAEWTLICKDGTRLAVEVSAKIHSDGRWQAIVRDVRQRKAAEQELLMLQEELEAVLDAAPDPIAIRTGDFYTFANPAFSAS